MAKECIDVHNLIAAVAEHYHYPQPPKLFLELQQILTNLVRMLFDLIASLLSTLPESTNTRMASDLMKAVLSTLGMASTVLFIWLLWKRMRELGRQAHIAKTLATETAIPFTSEDWQKQALALSQAGKRKEACRAILLCAIRLLHEQEVVPFSATRTNFEYSYALSANDQLRANFRLIADIVDLCWFGNKEANERDFANCQIYFQALKTSLVKLE